MRSCIKHTVFMADLTLVLDVDHETETFKITRIGRRILQSLRDEAITTHRTEKARLHALFAAVKANLGPLELLYRSEIRLLEAAAADSDSDDSDNDNDVNMNSDGTLVEEPGAPLPGLDQPPAKEAFFLSEEVARRVDLMPSERPDFNKRSPLRKELSMGAYPLTPVSPPRCYGRRTTALPPSPPPSPSPRRGSRSTDMAVDDVAASDEMFPQESDLQPMPLVDSLRAALDTKEALLTAAKQELQAMAEHHAKEINAYQTANHDFESQIADLRAQQRQHRANDAAFRLLQEEIDVCHTLQKSSSEEFESRMCALQRENDELKRRVVEAEAESARLRAKDERSKKAARATLLAAIAGMGVHND
ncbi:hypothetical protein B0H10DRAFT_495133 [Mycena sp. CBHHK59/15]|nr:hypothetical protein B0H10DRAFT_495133 [Mycena sp. CBHHK59/15]